MPRIRVYAFGTHPSRNPPQQIVSKSTARRWIGWSTHEQLNKYAIRERFANPLGISPGQSHQPPPQRWYSPDKLPPVELPHIRFVEPQSDNWRRDHRSVSFELRASSQAAEKRWLEAKSVVPKPTVA